ERIMRIAGRAGKRIEIGRIGQLVDIDHARIAVAQQMAHHGRADETRAAGHENRETPKAHGSGLPPRGLRILNGTENDEVWSGPMRACAAASKARRASHLFVKGIADGMRCNKFCPESSVND